MLSLSNLGRGERAAFQIKSELLWISQGPIWRSKDFMSDLEEGIHLRAVTSRVMGAISSMATVHQLSTDPSQGKAMAQVSEKLNIWKVLWGPGGLSDSGCLGPEPPTPHPASFNPSPPPPANEMSSRASDDMHGPCPDLQSLKDGGFFTCVFETLSRLSHGDPYHRRTIQGRNSGTCSSKSAGLTRFKAPWLVKTVITKEGPALLASSTLDWLPGKSSSRWLSFSPIKCVQNSYLPYEVAEKTK